MEFRDICKKYFQAFEEKNIKIINEMVDESIVLKDWESMLSGKDDFINFNKKLFLDVENISIIIKNQGTQNKSISKSVIVFNEIEICLNNNSIRLEVMDVIEFEVKTGLIKSIRAYKI